MVGQPKPICLGAETNQEVAEDGLDLDKEFMSPSEVYVENMGPNADIDPGIKWWQWSSLRPPPCGKKED